MMAFSYTKHHYNFWKPLRGWVTKDTDTSHVPIYLIQHTSVDHVMLSTCHVLYLGSGHNPKYTLSHTGGRRVEVLRFDNVSNTIYMCSSNNPMIQLRMLRHTGNTTKTTPEHIREYHHLFTEE